MNAKFPYKVLFVESGFGYGGSSAFLYSLLGNLDREKFEPIVALYSHNYGPIIQKIIQMGIEVIPLSKNGTNEHNHSKNRLGRLVALLKLLNITAIWNLLKLARQRKIELIALNNDVHNHVPSVIAAKIARIPCVCRKSGLEEGDKVRRIIGRYVDAYIAISEAAARELLRNRIPTRSLSVIYAGVDVRKYDPASSNREQSRKKLGIPDSGQVVGSIARIDEGKGHLDLIEAAAIVTKQYPDVKFAIVGGGIDSEGRELEQQLYRRVNELGISENIIFAGWQDDIPGILSAIDIFIQNPTYPEGLCISCLEAMAMAKPLVVTSAGGLAETTVDGVTGFVVPPGQPELLADMIIKLLKDKNLATFMGANARGRAEKEFNIGKNVAKVEDVFLKLLEIA